MVRLGVLLCCVLCCAVLFIMRSSWRTKVYSLLGFSRVLPPHHYNVLHRCPLDLAWCAAASCWGRKRALAFSGGSICVSITVTHDLLDGRRPPAPLVTNPNVPSHAGYDVWMMNTRGNTFSRGHARYKDTDSRFWAFSMDEMSLQVRTSNRRERFRNQKQMA